MSARISLAEKRPMIASGDSLANRMRVSPISLIDALHYARDIADHLRELHEDGRIHGEVNARLIQVRSSGAILLPPNGPAPFGSALLDVSAFGALFYELLTGRKPSTDALLSTPLQPASRKGPGAVQLAAVRLAEKCIGATTDTQSSMQRILTEIRLLSVQARQCQAGAGESSKALTEVPPEELPEEMDSAESIEAIEAIEVEPESPSKKAAKKKDPDLMADGKCPRCRCSKVRVSRPRNRIERFLRACGLPVRRCHRCYFRYIDFFKACLEMPTKKFNK